MNSYKTQSDRNAFKPVLKDTANMVAGAAINAYKLHGKNEAFEYQINRLCKMKPEYSREEIEKIVLGAAETEIRKAS